VHVEEEALEVELLLLSLVSVEETLSATGLAEGKEVGPDVELASEEEGGLGEGGLVNVVVGLAVGLGEGGLVVVAVGLVVGLREGELINVAVGLAVGLGEGGLFNVEGSGHGTSQSPGGPPVRPSP
jgi:hypothetical protein